MTSTKAQRNRKYARRLKFRSLQKRNSRRFVRQFQALPPELRNYIFDLVSTVDDIKIVIGRWYRPPPQLQVCRPLRRRFAQEYFYKTTVVFKRDQDFHAEAWIVSLGNSHRRELGPRSIQLICGPPGQKTCGSRCCCRWGTSSRILDRHWRDYLQINGNYFDRSFHDVSTETLVGLPAGVLRFVCLCHDKADAA